MAKTKIKPLGDRVLVTPLEEDTTSPSGIIIPDTAQRERPKQGKVIAVGTLEDVTDIKVGDIVLFSDYGFDTIKVDGEEYYIIKSENVLAVTN